MGRPSYKGFTVIEMIISIVLLGILGAYTFSFLGNSMGAYVRVRDHKILYDEARLALRRMADEIQDGDRSAAITVTPNTSISFTKSHPSATVITYTLSGGVLNRVSGGITNSLTGNVQAFIPAVDGTTKVVTLELVQSISGGGTVRFRTCAYPRNNS
ncbi:MAG: prepilin-type N-terminal cleavage/methylation domain-containing protein [Thermodesulfobacteriota bacterium]